MAAYQKLSSLQDFPSFIKNQDVVLYFNAPWCKVCAVQKPVLLDFVAKPNTNGIFIDIDIERFPELGEEYEVLSLPTFIVLHNKKITIRSIGFADSLTLSSLIDSF